MDEYYPRVPIKDPNGIRRYNTGPLYEHIVIEENQNNCVVIVGEQKNSPHQCMNPRGYGPRGELCHTHFKIWENYKAKAAKECCDCHQDNKTYYIKIIERTKDEDKERLICLECFSDRIKSNITITME
jgi:hypothetical protein